MYNTTNHRRHTLNYCYEVEYRSHEQDPNLYEDEFGAVDPYLIPDEASEYIEEDAYQSYEQAIFDLIRRNWRLDPCRLISIGNIACMSKDEYKELKLMLRYFNRSTQLELALEYDRTQEIMDWWTQIGSTYDQCFKPPVPGMYYDWYICAAMFLSRSLRADERLV